MPTDLLAPLAQFGAAGLIGWMWITERRAAASREQQLSEAHDRLASRREHLDALIRLVTDNTKALGAVEASHRELARVVGRLGDLLERGDRPGTLPGRAAG